MNEKNTKSGVSVQSDPAGVSVQSQPSQPSQTKLVQPVLGGDNASKQQPVVVQQQAEEKLVEGQ